MSDRDGRVEPGAEVTRLEDARGWDAPWRKWGPYLSERQWGTVREDYSATGDAWSTFRTTMRDRAPTTGEKTGWPVSATSSSACVSRWRCGTGPTRS